MRGAGPVGWCGEQVYAYFTVVGGVIRVRLSVDEADRLGAESVDGLVVRVRREPPFAWIELTPLAPSRASRAG